MINVHYWTRRNGKPARAYFPAVKVDRESDLSIRFITESGEKITVRKADLITIENDGDGHDGNGKKGGDGMKFYDIDSGETVSMDTLRDEYNDAIRRGEIDGEITFLEYVGNCMTCNGGTLVEL